MANPVTPHIINGIVYDIYGNKLADATVTVTHATITPVLSTTTDSNGEYNLNLANLSSQWSIGDSISVKATKTTEGTKTTSTIISSGGGQTVDITLDETSDFDFEIQSTLADRYPFTMSMITHYDGRKITRLRPLPIETPEVLSKYYPTDEDISSTPQYFSFTDRFGNWYIQQYNTTNGTFRYAKGTSSYNTNWTNRASLNYDYFYNIF